MAYFLSQTRRECLIANLGLLKMPRILAEDYSSIGDRDMRFIDRYVAACIWRISERTEQLLEPGTAHNEERADALATLLASDTLILAAYVGECKARKIAPPVMPRTCKAMDANAEELAVALHMILANSVTVQ
jgi:hypothetical protein